MNRHRFSRLALVFLGLAALALAPAWARAQCSITGPLQFCGAPVTLCGPDGGEVYEWVMPDGSVEWTQCVVANAAGSYQLRYVYPWTGQWVGPCAHVLEGAGGAPPISGEALACAGQAVQLCGPGGEFQFEWSGPAGLAANTDCISATRTGVYLLRVRPLPDGCWSDPAEQWVSFADCGPLSVVNCPRPAWWWAQQCPDHDRSGRRLDPAVMESIAGCVASHDEMLDAGFCRALLAHHRTLRMRAQRQVAAVWANVCAGDQGVQSRDGRPVALDPATAVDVAGYQGTVSSWLASADATLRQLSNTSERRSGSRDACRRLIRVAWHINHGLGIGPVCAPPAEDDGQVRAPQGGLGATAQVAGFDPEPLTAELMDDSDAPLAFGSIEPNPFKSTMRMAYAVTTTAASEVSIGVYDVSGRLVRELASGSKQPGQYEVQWDGRDTGGALVRGGLYFVMGRVGGEHVQTRVTFVR